jgi:hypothetical protein
MGPMDQRALVQVYHNPSRLWKFEQTVSEPFRTPRYRAYLLRFWEERRERPGQRGAWRFSLEDPHSGRRRGFANLKALVDFLQQEMKRDESRSEESTE